MWLSQTDELVAALIASGADLDGYRTEALADDIEDLRKALGYDQWNLLGLSYGTRVVLTVLRKHPSGVRSVVLDSVLPPEVNFDEVATTNLQRALNLVLDGCASIATAVRPIQIYAGQAMSTGHTDASVGAPCISDLACFQARRTGATRSCWT